MMDPLLDQVLVLRIIRIQHLDRLPPPLPLARIADLKRRRRDQHRQRQPLCINPRLHEFLRLAQIRISSHQSQRDAHRRNP